MTYNPLDAEEVQYGGGILGDAGSFKRTLPDFASSTANGGASVSPGPRYTNVEAGSTADDTAQLEIGDDEANVSRIVTYIWFRLSTDTGGSPSTHTLKVGRANSPEPTSERADGAYLDLKTEKFVVDNNKTAFSGTLGSYNNHLLVIVADNEANETRFTYMSQNTKETATISAAPTFMDSIIASAHSDGTSTADIISIKAIKNHPLPKK